MDNRASENVKYLEDIVKFINKKYFDNGIKVSVWIGDYREYHATKIEVVDHEVVSFVKVSYDELIYDRYGAIKTIIKQMILLYHHNPNVKANKLCSGRYLNRRFKKVAENIGCFCERDEKYGNRISALPDSLYTYLKSIDFESYEFYIPEKCIDFVNKRNKVVMVRMKKRNQFKMYCPACGASGWFTTYHEIVCKRCNVDWIKEHDSNS